ncbi:MAG: hypothetical protein LAN83_02445 [Acidobacteriia bacterium]|nr:hypothetical protein [Terriglobia bacterium]
MSRYDLSGAPSCAACFSLASRISSLERTCPKLSTPGRSMRLAGSGRGEAAFISEKGSNCGLHSISCFNGSEPGIAIWGPRTWGPTDLGDGTTPSACGSTLGREGTRTANAQKYRTNGVVSNLPQFRQAFGCKAGQAMVRENQCRVW